MRCFYDTMSPESVPSQKTQASSDYAQRIDRVIDYLRANLHRPVKLSELASVACFSEFHFHRVFEDELELCLPVRSRKSGVIETRDKKRATA